MSVRYLATGSVMASHKQMPTDGKYKSRDRALADIWDKAKSKLAVMVVECEDNISKDNSKLYVTLSWGKHKQHTSTAKKLPEQFPQWNEFFIFGVDGGGPLLIAEVNKAKNLGRDDCIGQATVFDSREAPEEEEVLDLWIPLQPREGGKKKGKVDGRLHVRILFSCSPETRPVEERGQQIFFYDDYIDKFKTGDLICYNGAGLLHTYNKLVSNTGYSHVGMIFRLPNKWTKREDLYVLEVTRNIDGFLDGFMEKPLVGLNLFRLFERLHHFNGTKIWYAPLKANCDTKAMVTEMWETHANNISCFDYFCVNGGGGGSGSGGGGSSGGSSKQSLWDSDSSRVFSLARALTREYKQGTLRKDSPLLPLLDCYSCLKYPHQSFELVDLFDGALLTALLRKGGLRGLSSSDGIVHPAEVAAYECYGEPVLLRDADFKAQVQRPDLPQQYYVMSSASSATGPMLGTPGAAVAVGGSGGGLLEYQPVDLSGASSPLSSSASPASLSPASSSEAGAVPQQPQQQQQPMPMGYPVPQQPDLGYHHLYPPHSGVMQYGPPPPAGVYAGPMPPHQMYAMMQPQQDGTGSPHPIHHHPHHARSDSFGNGAPQMYYPPQQQPQQQQGVYSPPSPAAVVYSPPVGAKPPPINPELAEELQPSAPSFGSGITPPPSSNGDVQSPAVPHAGVQVLPTPAKPLPVPPRKAPTLRRAQGQPEQAE